MESGLGDVPGLIGERALPGGGYAERQEGDLDATATAWAVVAMRCAGAPEELLDPPCWRLARLVQADGRVAADPGHPEAFWPTSVALLALAGLPEHGEAADRMAAFLLATTGRHWTRAESEPLGHDTSIRGWPWTENTHSWVEPTALAILALRAAGHALSSRVEEASRMLLDRQIAAGGWNYGNPSMFGSVLRPIPESTGHALAALFGDVPREEVGASLAWLASAPGRLSTPLALSWAVLGLAAWGERPEGADLALAGCLDRQGRYGSYDTSLLAQLAVAAHAWDGLLESLDQPPARPEPGPRRTNA